jgi:hypothetical protein
MRKIFIAAILCALIRFLNCSTTGQMSQEPLEKKNLLIGSLIFDIDGYEENFTTIRQNIDVAIIGRYLEGGTFHNFGQWVSTDKNGYFYLENVPDGEYAIKGFQTRFIGIGDLLIANELIDAERNYYELQDNDIISFTGDLFDTSSSQRIVNFQHNLFVLHRGGIVSAERYNRIQDLKLSTGEVINHQPVPFYFAEKFEGSGWETILNLHLK